EVAAAERGSVELERLDRWIEGEGLGPLDESAVGQGERAEEEEGVGWRYQVRTAFGVEDDGSVLPEAGNRDAEGVVGIRRYRQAGEYVATTDEVVEVDHGCGQWWRHELRCSTADQRGERQDTHEAWNGHHEPPRPGTRRAFVFVD